MATKASLKIRRHGWITAALTVLIVLTTVLLNATVTTLALRYGWYVNMNPNLYYPVTDTCFAYLDEYVIPDAKSPIRLIFCDDKKNIEADAIMSYVLNTATELQERYPDTVRIEYLNVWENPSIAREYGVKADTSVVVASGDTHRVCTLRDFFVFPAGDTENPTAYNGEKRFAVAMKAVVSKDAPLAYFTLNHGESMTDYALMSAVTDAGYNVTYLDALSFDIPDNCDLLVTFNPARDFTAIDGVSGVSEIDKLDAYLARGGKYMAFVSADTFAAGSYSNLEAYLATWGVTFDHRPGAGGVEECFSIRDTAHALSTDGYTIVGRIPADGQGASIMANVTGSLRVSNATGISIAEGFVSDGGDYTSGSRTLSPLLRTYAGAEAWAGGRAVDRTTTGYDLVTLTRDSATGGSMLVCSSTAFATEASLASGVYDNGAFLLTALQAMGTEETPVHLTSQPFSDNTIHTLTTAQARNITLALVALPVLAVTATGLIVLIRRRFA
ncbi:MAG: Gldg family protein [Clostridia bacterium]|nr:Gldg family protein [Clostridia bacterium]